MGSLMFRLDYVSCVLTIASTVLVGRRMWQGWVVAALNSVIICIIGFQTAQIGLLHANVFCIAMYLYNVAKWRAGATGKAATAGHASGRLNLNRLSFSMPSFTRPSVIRASLGRPNKDFIPGPVPRRRTVPFDTILLADEHHGWSSDRIFQRELQRHAESRDPV
jgi:hypothetical protein